jgi:hypothetical protein
MSGNHDWRGNWRSALSKGRPGIVLAAEAHGSAQEEQKRQENARVKKSKERDLTPIHHDRPVSKGTRTPEKDGQ